MPWSREPKGGPTLAELSKVISYDRETGAFCRLSNGSRADKAMPHGYRRVSIDGVRYLAHRLAWLFVSGQWPQMTVDHIDGDPSNNRIGNLRLATRLQQQGNRRPQRSALGVKGVQEKAPGKFVAHICLNRKTRHLGVFDTAEAAAAAYANAAQTYFGEFSRS